MDRRRFNGTLTGGLLAAPLAADARQPGKVYRIGYLSAGSSSAIDPNFEAFVEKLRDLDYVPEQNVVVEQRRVGSGIVTSLSRPGGNITGLTHISKEVHKKRLQLLKELVPSLSRIAVLAGPSRGLTITETHTAAQALGLHVDVVEAHGPDELKEAFSQAARGGAQALVVLPDALFWAHRQRVGHLAAMNRLPGP